MADRRTVAMRIVVDPWVMPYLQLFVRLGLGDRAGRVVGQFVAEHGSRLTS